VTLVELMVGAVILSVAIAALLGAFLTQMTLNEHARNRSLATNDVARVMEEIRRRNSGGACNAPSAAAPAGYASWNAWLADAGAAGGGGKSVQPDPNVNELVAVSASGANPLTVTVAVCWRQRDRIIGECTWNGAALAVNPGAGGDLTVTESPAQLATLLTCRR
jgi:type II secretory pathway pseudopilin PulG